MNEGRINKLESSIRIEELNPKDTLIRAGFRDEMRLCDIGAGTGIFTFPAAEISSDVIYALEVSDSMLEILKSRMVEYNSNNVKIMKVNSDILPLDNDSCDMAVLVTVLHELNNKEAMLHEVKRILKGKGKLMIIEFYKRETPIGPPIDHRISEGYVEEVCNLNGFKKVDKFSLGDNFYCAVFEI